MAKNSSEYPAAPGGATWAAVRSTPFLDSWPRCRRAAVSPRETSSRSGERISWDEATRRYNSHGADGHILLRLSDGTVNGGGVGGNTMRWLNHGCDRHCEAAGGDGRVWVQTARPATVGEEHFIGYSLTADEDDRAARLAYVCGCAADACRATVLAG